MPEPIEDVVPLELDSPARGATVARNPVIVAGWTLDKEAPLLAVLVSVGDELWIGAQRGLARPDVADALQELVEHGAATAGWRAELDLTRWPGDRAELKVVVLRANGTWAVRARNEIGLRGAPGG